MPPPERTSPELRRLLILVAASALVRLATLEAYPLMDTTEARYGEIARRMAESGDWVTPWIGDGVPFWGKPPLSFWMTAASFEALGAGAFAARLPHWLAAVATGWLVFGWARRRSRRAGVHALALTAASALFFAAAGAVMTDMALALGLAMAMRGFWQALHEPARRGLRGQALLFLGVAIGLLAKGPIALVLAGLPIGAWAVATSNLRRALQTVRWLAGSLAVLAVVLPWYLLAEWRTPGFLEYFIAGEHWHRFTVPGWRGDLYGHSHEFARGTIWLFALLALLPWSILVPLAAWRWRRDAGPVDPADRPRILYLGCWALAPCVLFTFAGNILWTYFLPGVPAAAMLGAILLGRLPQRPVDRLVIPAGIATTVVVGVAVVAAFNAGGWGERTSTQALIAAYDARRAAGEPLVFLRRRPLSGAFYSNGRAEEAGTLEALHARLARGPAFVAVKEKHADRVPAGFRAGLQSVLHVGDYELLYARRAAARAGAGTGLPVAFRGDAAEERH
jgi:4-amino-4-deoxy-L-arabinose transferase-like glycosyltransferase